jgi:amphi-Trp domain-containing protein
MTEFEWEKKTNRDDAAKLLRQIADGLTGDGKVELEQDGWELKLSVAQQVELEVELKVEGSKTQLEVELTWASGRGGRSKASGGS